MAPQFEISYLHFAIQASIIENVSPKCEKHYSNKFGIMRHGTPGVNRDKSANKNTRCEKGKKSYLAFILISFDIILLEMSKFDLALNSSNACRNPNINFKKLNYKLILHYYLDQSIKSTKVFACIFLINCIMIINFNGLCFFQFSVLRYI